MAAEIVTGAPLAATARADVMLRARPEPIRINPAQIALVVVDMQNAYASPGGYIDIAGFDVSGARARRSPRPSKCWRRRAQRACS